MAFLAAKLFRVFYNKHFRL